MYSISNSVLFPLLFDLQPVSESDLIDEFSKDFACPVPPTEKSKPADVSKVNQEASFKNLEYFV